MEWFNETKHRYNVSKMKFIKIIWIGK